MAEYKTGKICYLEIPAIDIETSAAFYKNVFGWQYRKRGDGALAFDDTVGQVSGTWVTGKKPMTDTNSLIIYIMLLEDINITIDLINKHGGKIVHPVGLHPHEVTALFSDPAGNVFGLFQQR
ncbi:MAG: VOC family protein [Filimonas sp.]|nr:VOC family protein [Filimonas sp.]